jgi:hypothetical protein
VTDTPHTLQLTREAGLQWTDNGWTRSGLTGRAQTTCDCGIDTGMVNDRFAEHVFHQHLQQICEHTPANVNPDPGTPPVYLCACCRLLLDAHGEPAPTVVGRRPQPSQIHHMAGTLPGASPTMTP